MEMESSVNEQPEIISIPDSQEVECDTSTNSEGVVPPKVPGRSKPTPFNFSRPTLQDSVKVGRVDTHLYVDTHCAQQNERNLTQNYRNDVMGRLENIESHGHANALMIDSRLVKVEKDQIETHQKLDQLKDLMIELFHSESDGIASTNV
jgi:hypothetical protein